MVLTVSKNLNNVVSDEALSLFGLDNEHVLSSVSLGYLLDDQEDIVSLLDNLVPDQGLGGLLVVVPVTGYVGSRIISMLGDC